MPMVALLGLSACTTETVTRTETVIQTETVTYTYTFTASPSPSPTPDITPVSQEQSQQIAEDYVRNCPTFAFDGIEETLRLVETITLRCPYCWEFVFRFQSRHAGYGDRTGQVLAQVLTTHTARIIVQEGEVIQAVMDDEWDMMQQKPIKG
ncbi:MAG TPA: hypothetical protein G4O03_03050 [Dehalococcoidia bacterium]|nr:hypothetical protein [Dehalococcoidia bacterium]